jgi:hypothetical protein
MLKNHGPRSCSNSHRPPSKARQEGGCTRAYRGHLSPGIDAEQAASGLGIEAQRATAHAYAERKGLNIVDEFCDNGVSAKSSTGRPGALAALAAVRGGLAAGLLVAKMDRLSRSVVGGATLMEAARREGWALHFADLDIDTGTPAGEMARTSSSPGRSTNAASSVNVPEMLWRPSAPVASAWGLCRDCQSQSRRGS